MPPRPRRRRDTRRASRSRVPEGALRPGEGRARAPGAPRPLLGHRRLDVLLRRCGSSRRSRSGWGLDVAPPAPRAPRAGASSSYGRAWRIERFVLGPFNFHLHAFHHAVAYEPWVPASAQAAERARQKDPSILELRHVHRGARDAYPCAAATARDRRPPGRRGPPTPSRTQEDTHRFRASPPREGDRRQIHGGERAEERHVPGGPAEEDVHRRKEPGRARRGACDEEAIECSVQTQKTADGQYSTPTTSNPVLFARCSKVFAS